MNSTSLTPRAHQLLTGIEAWAHRGPVRAVVVKVGVSVVGPLVVVAGVAMLVLPGPGLVVMALGAALLALEYDWARRALDGLRPDARPGASRGAPAGRVHGPPRPRGGCHGGRAGRDDRDHRGVLDVRRDDAGLTDPAPTGVRATA